jgi:diaminohydroxyphosphoribosylaminopyrimidine deaminase/5-amino-6-(5-phosphoribosylamino)uracil reductase
MDEDFDRRAVAAAIRLGAGALGSTWPNPAVGAILVKDGRVVGRGRTGAGGRPHGEALALAHAGERARGATLYVSLEPCAHHGRTPPCVDAIIAAGVARVVVTGEDPDPRVAGTGIQRLRAAGVELVTGVLAAEAARVQAGHLSRIGRGRPHVVLKLAVSADDAIGRRGEGQLPVSGDIARRHAQALRARFDAILVGRGTVEADNPALTCRLPGLAARSPVRVVLDTAGRLRRDRNIFSGDAPLWIFSARGSTALGPAEAAPPPRSPGDGRAGTRRLFAPAGETGGLDLEACARRLGAEGITRLLVEGGARVARSLLDADLVDEAILFRSPATLGGDTVPALAGLPLAAIEASAAFRRIERRPIGEDMMSRYLRAR